MPFSIKTLYFSRIYRMIHFSILQRFPLSIYAFFRIDKDDIYNSSISAPNSATLSMFNDPNSLHLKCQRNSTMKKTQVPIILVVGLLLTGCFNDPIDSAPIQLNKQESFAMQVLKSGFNTLPFKMPEANLPENGYYDTLSYTAIHTLGLSANSGIGGLSRLGLVASGGTEKDLIHYIAWVPADNIAITDSKIINNYVHQHYLNPAVNAFITSDFNLKMQHPTKLVNNDSIEIKVSGDSCWPITREDATYGECEMLSGENIVAVRYATEESGLPFEPTIKANRYIIVRITDNFKSIGAIQHISSNMIYAYIPSMGDTAQTEHLNRFSPRDNPIVSKNIAYVIGDNRKVNYFAKIQQ